MPDARPNILLIMSDEHDPAAAGCYGDPLVRTPHLDALAERGVRFDAAYCNSPLCVPSRMSVTAGQYISRCGGWSNACRLASDDYPSLPQALNAVGYESYLCGKQHYHRTHRNGFTDILPDSNSRQGDNRGHHDGRGGRRAAESGQLNVGTWQKRSDEFYAAEHSRVLEHDRAVTHTARGFLAGRHRDDPPFFLFAGYVAPHFPLIVPPEIAAHDTGRTPPPIGRPNWEPIVEGVGPLNEQHLRRGFGLIGAEVETERKGRDLHWALTDWFDGEVGKLLDALGRSDVADNTVVIYTSDHGENKGDHGLWWKNCMYEHGARVPLIVSWPARWAGGQRRTAACSLVDLVQTLIELGGGEAHEPMDGDSMLPWLDDAAHAWKDFALSEYYGHNVASGFTMLRQGKWKYIYHARIDEKHGPERQLFDLENDPQELHDLAREAAQAGRMEAMHAAMVAQLCEEPEAIEARCRAEQAVGYAD